MADWNIKPALALLRLTARTDQSLLPHRRQLKHHSTFFLPVPFPILAGNASRLTLR